MILGPTWTIGASTMVSSLPTRSSSAAKAAKGGNWRQPVLRTIWLGSAAASDATHDKCNEELEVAVLDVSA